jgi:hypothetical protein
LREVTEKTRKSSIKRTLSKIHETFRERFDYGMNTTTILNIAP